MLLVLSWLYYSLKYFLPAGVFVSEAELQKVTAKLKMFEEISARLKSSQSSSEERIVRLEQDLETVQLENIQFRKQINDLRREICPGCALISPALT